MVAPSGTQTTGQLEPDWEEPLCHDRKLSNASPEYKSSPECAALLSKRIPLTVTVKDHAVGMVTETQLTESAAEHNVRE